MIRFASEAGTFLHLQMNNNNPVLTMWMYVCVHVTGHLFYDLGFKYHLSEGVNKFTSSILLAAL